MHQFFSVDYFSTDVISQILNKHPDDTYTQQSCVILHLNKLLLLNCRTARERAFLHRVDQSLLATLYIVWTRFNRRIVHVVVMVCRIPHCLASAARGRMLRRSSFRLWWWGGICDSPLMNGPSQLRLSIFFIYPSERRNRGGFMDGVLFVSVLQMQYEAHCEIWNNYTFIQSLLLLGVNTAASSGCEKFIQHA